MATIKAIEGRSVHQIQSGQVIVDLCSVVKELLENSLDAGATSIDVRFKAQGLDAIEVQDNGSGVPKADYDTLGLKHYTSKLSSYDDLAALATFGFRGEALSSLCALARLSVITAQVGEAPKGTRLEYETSGKLGSTSVAAAQKGTLVCVESLFHNLPVRRRELEKNIKREYGKVLNVLNAYACICTGVKLSVSNQATKGKKMTVFATKNNTTTKENIANIYGAKTIPALISLCLRLEMQPSAPSQALAGFHTQSDSSMRTIEVQGHVSRPAHGEGRQTPDRQMFFVNSRPCGLPQLAKAFNEVYKSYNISQSPFILANLKMDTNAYDVNVSPDKRTIMLHDQPRLIESLKEALIELFEAQDQTVPLSQRPSAKLPSFKPLAVNRESSVFSRSPSDTSKARSPTPADNRTQSTIASSTVDSSNSLPDGGQVADLTAQFVGRNVEARSDRPKLINANQQPSRDKERLAKKFSVPTRNELSVSPATELGDEAEGEAVMPSPPIEKPSDAQLRIVQDFNDRIASQRAKGGTKEADQVEQRESGRKPDAEEKIPSISNSPRKASPGVVQTAFDRMRPARAPMEIATINIGSNATTTAVIGSQSAFKKRRIHISPAAGSEGRCTASRFSQSMRGFAAPGTQIDSEDGPNPPPENSSQISHNTGEAANEEDSISHKHVESGLRTGQASHPDDSDDSELSETGGDAPAEESSDDEYVDEVESRARAEAQTRRLVEEAEQAAATPTSSSLKRAANVLKRSSETTVSLVTSLATSCEQLQHEVTLVAECFAQAAESRAQDAATLAPTTTDLAAEDPETRLSLTISKSNFASMRIVGQFNLGFILAVRPALGRVSDDLFIIDQHASDEIYNFHRLSATTQLTPQPLVRPQPLELTAIEEETVMTHAAHSLTLNGFEVGVDESGDSPVGQRCRLVTLPTSKDTVFDTRDLEELLVLLSDQPSPSTASREVVRPSKVRKMLAMRACRSSIMVGRALTGKQMGKVVRHMGEMERPWNCPHGRPTMRHLTGLDRGSGKLNSWNETCEDAWDHQESADDLAFDDGGRRAGTTLWSGWGAWLSSTGRGKRRDGLEEEEESYEEGVTSEDVDDGAGDAFATSGETGNEVEEQSPTQAEDGNDRQSDDLEDHVEEEDERQEKEEENAPPRTLNLSSFRNTAS